MRKRPLLLGACVFVQGLLFGCMTGQGSLEPPATGMRAAIVLIAAATLGYSGLPYLIQHNYRRFAVRLVGLLLLFICGGMRMQSQIQFRERELAQIREGTDISLCGEIYKKEFRRDQLRVYLKNCYAVADSSSSIGRDIDPATAYDPAASDKKSIACNQVMLYLKSDDYSIGDILIVNGQVHMFSSATNEGAFDEKTFYFSQKIDFAMWEPAVRSAVPETTGRVEEEKLRQGLLVSARLWRLRQRFQVSERLWQLRQRISAIYTLTTGQNVAGVLAVMLLGDKSRLDASIQKLYQNAGISHILAISGLHVSLVGMGLYRFFRKRGMRYASAFGAAFTMVLLYAFMSGNGVSTQRAVGMMLLCMLADVFGRGYDLLNALGGVVLILLVENPFLLWYSGFQFSVTAILVIGTAGVCISVETDGKIDENQDDRKNGICSGVGGCAGDGETGAASHKNTGRGNRRLGAWMNRLYAAVIVWLGTLPLVAFYYYEIPIYAAFLNMLILPLMPVVFLCGLVGGIIGCASPAIAKILLLPCGGILQIYEKLAELTLRLPGATLIVGKPGFFRIIFFYMLLLLASFVWKKRKSLHWIRAAGIAFLLALLLWPQKTVQEIVVLDVGQGDGTFLRTKENVTLFVDGGSSNVKGVGTYRILPFLKAKGAGHIDYWLVSHGDLDHISGLLEVLESGYRIDHLVVSEWAFSNAGLTENMQKLQEWAALTDTPILLVDAGKVLQMSESRLSFLWPAGELVSSDDVNDNSLVFLYEDATVRGIFAGDISSATEKKLVDIYTNRNAEIAALDIDFYKVNHHGSKYSNCTEWLEALSPKIATISCGNKNRYGHPHEEALERLEASSTDIYRTDELGAITIRPEDGGRTLAAEGYNSKHGKSPWIMDGGWKN